VAGHIKRSELGPPPAAGHPCTLRAGRAGEGRAGGGVRRGAHPERGPADAVGDDRQGEVLVVCLSLEARADNQPAREAARGIR
jgi:hypothetical protein